MIGEPLTHPAPDQEMRALQHMGLSFLLHVGFLAASAVVIPALGETDPSSAGETARYLLAQAVGGEAEREDVEAPVAPTETGDADGREPSYSKCGEENGGSMGHPAAPERARRYGVQGPADNADPHIARGVGSGDVWWELPLFPPRDASWGGDRDAPTMPWGRDDSLGTDAASAHAHMWGDEIGDAYGSPGMGMGRHELCETCGDSGRGATVPPAAAPGEEDAPPVGCLGLLLLTD